LRTVTLAIRSKFRKPTLTVLDIGTSPDCETSILSKVASPLITEMP
jgi:hypothetical protein